MSRLTDDMKSELCNLVTRDDAGRHFTEWSEHYNTLEQLGLVTIHRPVHHTGVCYSPEHWSVELTDDGQSIVSRRGE